MTAASSSNKRGSKDGVQFDGAGLGVSLDLEPAYAEKMAKMTMDNKNISEKLARKKDEEVATQWVENEVATQVEETFKAWKNMTQASVQAVVKNMTQASVQAVVKILLFSFV